MCLIIFLKSPHCAWLWQRALSPVAPPQRKPIRAQPIKIVVGFGPASAADILTRLVGKRMEAKLGQPVIVENRAGNSSMIGAEAVARAPAD